MALLRLEPLATSGAGTYMRSKLGDIRIWLCNFVIAFVPSHAIRLWYYRRIMRFRIGAGSSIHLGCRFTFGGNFSMGSNCTINQFCHLDNRGSLTFGDNVSISPHVAIVTADHDIDSPDFAGRIRPCSFGDYSFVGFRATILPGVAIGTAAVVCASALVTKSVADRAVVGGVPARELRQRNGEPAYSASYKRFMN